MCHAKQRSHAELLHLCRRQDLDLQAKFRQRLHPVREAHGKQHVGWFVHKVAGEVNAIGDRRRHLEPLPGTTQVWRHDGQCLEDSAVRLLRFIVMEIVDTQLGPIGDAGCHFACRHGLGGELGRNRRRIHLGRLQGSGDGPAQHFDIERRQAVDRAEPEQEDPLQRAIGCNNVERTVPPAGEGRSRHGARNLALGTLVGGGGKASELFAFWHEQHENAGFRQGGSSKCELHDQPFFELTCL